MSDKQFKKRQEEDRKMLRELEVQAIRAEIEAATPEEKAIRIYAGDRSFTLEQLLKEVQEGTVYGETFLKMRGKSRIERLRRK